MKSPAMADADDPLDRALAEIAAHRAPPELGARIVARARATPQATSAGRRLWRWLTGPEVRPGGWQPALLGALILLLPLAGGYLAGAGVAPLDPTTRDELAALAEELTWSAFEPPTTEIDLER